MIVPVTLVMTAAAAFINIWLSIRTSQVRLQDKVLHGDDGNPRLIRRMRAHANFVEYTPFVLLLILVIELSSASTGWLLLAGLAYLLARVAHAVGMDFDKSNPWRAGGIVATLLVLAGLAVWAVVLAYVATGSAGAGALV